MKKLASIIIFALIFAGCYEDNCECGEVVEKNEQTFGSRTFYSFEIRNFCTGNNTTKAIEDYKEYYNTKYGAIYCLDREW